MTAAHVNGVDIEYESVGEGPPLLLVMGLGAQLIVWPDEFVQRLADRGFRVIRYDNRDVGLSSKMPHDPPTVRRMIGGLLVPRLAKSPYLRADMADDAAALLEHLGIDRAHVVGASMGGMIAQTLAIDHPSRVASLTSIMSNTGDRTHGRISFSLMRKLPKYLKPTSENRIEDAIAGARLTSGPLFDEAYERSVLERSIERDPDRHGSARQTAAITASPDRTRALHDVTAPTLVIHGLADPLVLPSGGVATAKAIPGSRLLMFPDMGHNLPPKYWDEVIDAIAANAARATGIETMDADRVQPA
jgi:pimeloyl-ACP methyl ester carboxylesterase